MQGRAALLKHLPCMSCGIIMRGYGTQPVKIAFRTPDLNPVNRLSRGGKLLEVEMQGRAALLKDLPCMPSGVKMRGYDPQPVNNGLLNTRPEPCQ
jgi:hypothetical protein